MKVKNVEEIQAFLQPIAEENGAEIVEVEFKQGHSPALTVYIDAVGGVDLNLCEKVHRAIDPLLDEADPIDVPYILEVSSPGIERDIRTDAHILACMGEEIEAKLFAPLNGRRSYVGEIAAYADGILTLSTPEGDVAIPRAAISHMNTTYHD